MGVSGQRSLLVRYKEDSPVRITKFVEDVREALPPLTDRSVRGLARWELQAAQALSGSLTDAAALLEAAWGPSPEGQLAALPSTTPWIPPQQVVDTSVEEEFVRITIARLDAARARGDL